MCIYLNVDTVLPLVYSVNSHLIKVNDAHIYGKQTTRKKRRWKEKRSKFTWNSIQLPPCWTLLNFIWNHPCHQSHYAANIFERETKCYKILTHQNQSSNIVFSCHRCIGILESTFESRKSIFDIENVALIIGHFAADHADNSC